MCIFKSPQSMYESQIRSPYSTLQYKRVPKSTGHVRDVPYPGTNSQFNSTPSIHESYLASVVSKMVQSLPTVGSHLSEITMVFAVCF
jgi:hypothetical protein